MDGKGSGVFVLDAGCHRFGLFAREPRGGRYRLDLDGSVRRDDGDLLGEDQTVAPDVHIDVCVAVVTHVVVAFEGAPRGAPVVVIHGSHDLPDHLPGAWGPEPRARFAAALFAHRIAAPPDDPVLLAQGASGIVPIPLETEPGACYLAIASLERGRGHGIGVSATLGARLITDERGAKDAALVAFCAQDARHATVEVDARSAGSGWALVVFRTQGGVWSASW